MLSLANNNTNMFCRHLARNPFICDCNLRWLSEYLQSHPIETSGARCQSPRRMQRKKIGLVKNDKFRCKGMSLLTSSCCAGVNTVYLDWLVSRGRCWSLSAVSDGSSCSLPSRICCDFLNVM